MARMYGNDEYPSGNFCDSSQLTNWILDSGATCHMTPEISDIILCLLEDMDKYIEVADGHHVTAKQKVQSTVMYILSSQCYTTGHTCLFHREFCTVYFGEKEKNAVT